MNIAPNRIVDMASAFYDSCVLFTATDLGIFARLAELGSANSEVLSAALGLNPHDGRLLLNSCVALQLLEKNDGIYRNSPESAAFLVPGQRGDLSSALCYNRDVYQAWGKLNELAKTGVPVESPQLHLGDDAQRTRTFVMSMQGKTMGMAFGAMPMLDYRGRKQLLYVGGGPGTFSVLISKANPEIRCTVLDLPPIVAIANELIAAQGASGTVSALPGDYHTTPFPGGNDAINIFGVLHQESPATIREMLRRSFDALTPGGMLCVMDMMTDSTRTSPKFSALFAVNVALTKEHGWVFSDSDLEGWMKEAGFANFSVRPLAPPIPHWLAVAYKLA